MLILHERHSSAQTIGADGPALKREHVIEAYVHGAFGPDRPALRKLDMSMPIGAAYQCNGIEPAECNQAVMAAREAIHVSNNFQLDFNKSPSVINIVFSKGQPLAGAVQMALTQFHGGFVDTSDPECAAFSIADGSSIKKIELLFSTDQPPLKLRFCIAYQLSQAMGLNPFDGVPFSVQWQQHLSKATEDTFPIAVNRLGGAEYIHMCPELHSGMSPAEVNDVLSKPDTCLDRSTLLK